MKIALDAMGSDAHPVPDVSGAVLAAREYGVTVILVGDENKIKPELAKHDTRGLDLPIVHTPTAIAMTDHVDAVKSKKDSSMNLAVKLVREKQADAFVTAGNTGAAMAAAIAGPYLLGRIKGIKRPALTTTIPTATGRTLLLDIGANTEVKPEYLYQFALMGSIYVEKVWGLTRPRIGLLSNGEEEGKGPQVVRDAYALLKQSKLNFVGNAEGRDIPKGTMDVIVCDGYVGNVAIKLSESLAKTLVGFIKDEIKKRPLAMLGALLAKPAVDALRARLDPSEVGGGILLGVDGVVIIGHGSSDAKAIKNAIRVAKEAVEGNIVELIRSGVTETGI
ncbi:MAG: phosphate acyltransferase PlsX [Anaerolineae bacterium]|nr:phosphate acyltransferase PlsX [Anaerolineae bacterium]